jgi:hypothetical protein
MTNRVSETVMNVASYALATPFQLLTAIGRYLPLPSMNLFKPSAADVKKHVFLEPPSAGGTFRYEDQLPPLPVPELKDTLQLYVESCRPHLTGDEMDSLVRLVETFENGVGAELHAKLVKKAAESKNWVSYRGVYFVLLTQSHFTPF